MSNRYRYPLVLMARCFRGWGHRSFRCFRSWINRSHASPLLSGLTEQEPGLPYWLILLLLPREHNAMGCWHRFLSLAWAICRAYPPGVLINAAVVITYHVEEPS